MLELFRELDNLKLHFNPNGLLALNISLGFIMFGVALGIRLKNFKKLLKRPKPIIIGFLAQFVVLPAMTFVLAILLSKYITVGVALGMILVAACPGGNISNFISSLAKGNVELSISLTALATIAAIVLTPFNFAFWGDMYIRYLQATNSAALLQPLVIDTLQIFKTVFILLGIPVIAGMTFAWKFPKITDKISKPIRSVSIGIFMLIVVLAFINNYDYFVKYIKYIMIVVLIHNGVALLSGFSMASIFGIDRRNRRAITIETGIQNSGLALVLLFNEYIFPEGLPIGGMMFIAGWWGIWHMISGIGLASIWSRIPLKIF